MKIKSSDRLWITWEKQRRNRTLSLEFNASLCEYSYKLPRLIKYPFLLILTFFKIIKSKPKILFVQNPSIVLSLFCVFLGKLIGLPVVVDAHNSGVFPFSGKSLWAVKVCDLINRNASFVIVSNERLQRYVLSKKGNCVVLPDPIPKLPKRVKKEGGGVFKVLFVCTWADDEPYEEVIKASKKLDPSIRVYITGNSFSFDDKLSGKVSNNVSLTGYLPDDEYERLLAEVDVVMDLTTFDDCLVCGAYESLAAEKPIILSDNPASRAYFRKGVVNVENTEQGVFEGIIFARDNILLLTSEIEELKVEIEESWAIMFQRVNDKVSNLI